MAQIRVYKKPNGGVVYSNPSDIFQGTGEVEEQVFQFTVDLITDNVVAVDVDGITLTQNFDTDHDTTVTALAAQIATQPNVRSAVFNGVRAIVIDALFPGMTVSLSNYSVTGGASQADISVIANDPRTLTFDDVNWPSWTEGLDYADIDEASVPESNSETGNWHEQIYFDGAAIEANLTVDTGWDSQLKPETLITREYLERIRTAYDDEQSNAVAATGTVTYGSPSNDDTIVVDGTTFTKKASGNGTTEFSTISELTTLINSMSSVNAADDATTITITAYVPGTSGNSITLSKTGSALTLSGATLSGGTDPNAVTLAFYQGKIDEVYENIEMGHTCNLYPSTEIDISNPLDEPLDELALFVRNCDLENLNSGTNRPTYRTNLEAKIAEIEAAIAGR